MTPRQLRDVIAALLMLAGVAGVVTVVWIAKPLAAIGLISAVVFAIGVVLTYDR